MIDTSIINMRVVFQRLKSDAWTNTKVKWRVSLFGIAFEGRSALSFSLCFIFCKSTHHITKVYICFYVRFNHNVVQFWQSSMNWKQHLYIAFVRHVRSAFLHLRLSWTVGVEYLKGHNAFKRSVTVDELFLLECT